MAVEEVRNSYLSSALCASNSHDVVQEFSIEIPDEEADAILTVQQGTSSLLCPSPPFLFALLMQLSLRISAIEYIEKTPAGQ